MAVSSRKSIQASEVNILLTVEETQCSFCCLPLKIADGLLLQDCLHAFCRNCITTWIENADNVPVRCPMDCGGALLEREIKALVPLEVFDLIQKRSFDKAINETSDIFKCKTPRCRGLCFVENGATIYHCDLCRKCNCIKCSDIHEGLTCDEYQEEIQKCVSSGIESPRSHVKQMIQQRNKTNGFEQLVSSSFIKNSLKKTTNDDSKYDDIGFYSKMIELMTENGVFDSVTAFECPVCYTDTPPGQGIILNECDHVFCKACIISQINYSEAIVKCPNQECTGKLTPREIQKLAPQTLIEKITKRNWSLAEAVISNRFHCLTINCSGFCELVGNVNAFKCSVCMKTNCLPCSAIHENVSCADYKNRITQTANDELSSKALANLISTGNAMHCVTCNAIVQKDQGCDAITCTLCRTQLCWATKGPRWGKGGVGDTSGGCHCGVNGVRCHKNCRNCH